MATISDKNVAQDAQFARQFIPFQISESAGLTDAAVASLVVGYPFEIVGVQHRARAATGTPTYNVKIGTVSALNGATTPTAGTRADAVLSATRANRLGGEASVLNLHVTTAARTAGAVTAGANTGNGVPGTLTLGASAQAGTYTLRCITAAANAGTFAVFTPQGGRLQDLTVAVAYSNAHFGITIADGSTDFIVGDTFTFVVADGGSFSDLAVTVVIRPRALRSQ